MKFQDIEKIKFIFLIVILILVNVFINYPYSKKLKEIKNELNSEVDRIKIAFNIKQSPQETLNQYQEIKDQLINYEEAFFRQGQELDLFENLETLSQKNQLTYEINLDQSSQEINDKIYKLNIRLNLRGNYYNILNYLDELNNFQYKLTIKSLNLDKQADDLNLTLLASSYWLYEEIEKN